MLPHGHVQTCNLALKVGTLEVCYKSSIADIKGGEMFCEECGIKIADDVKFCGGCGSKVNEDAQASTSVNVENALQDNSNVRESAMLFCRGCGRQIHKSAPTCPHCGCVQHSVKAAPPNQTYLKEKAGKSDLTKSFHITLIAAAATAVVLLYTTRAFPLIGLATGITFGLSLRLFFIHNKNNFLGTQKVNWILLAVFSTLAFLFHLFSNGNYNIQALFLIFVAVRSLMLYFIIYKDNANGS